MKIVDYNTFIELPAGTIYSQYSPCVFGSLYVKQETINETKDFYLSRIQESFIGPNGECEQFYELCDLMEKGIDLRADYLIQERDGLFEYDRQFLVYDKTDISDLINFLKTLL